MRDILDRAATAGIHASQCTPQWFIDQYLSHCAYPSYRKWQRINFLEGVESSDENSSIPAKQTSHPPDAQTHIPRYLRRVHKNEVWSIFVSHSEWILSLIETHKDLKGKVNSHSWRIFFLTVSELRQKALLDQNTGGKWGIKDENIEEMDKYPISNIPSPSLSTKAVVPQPTTSKRINHKSKRSTKV
jgi:hypothetical protein